MRALALACVLLAAGCAKARAPEAPLLRGVSNGRAVAIVVDATLQGEARVTAKTVLDAATELAKAEPLPVGVFACQPEGPRVVLGLGDAVAAAVEPCEGRADPGP